MNSVFGWMKRWWPAPSPHAARTLVRHAASRPALPLTALQAGLIAGALLCAGCGGPKEVYSLPEYGLAFARPSGWEVASQSDMPLTVRFESRSSPGAFTVIVRPDRDLGFAPPSRYLNVFAERRKDEDPSFRISGLSETNANGITGAFYTATAGSPPGPG